MEASLSHRRKLARAELHIENVEAMLVGWSRDGYRAFEEPNSEGRMEYRAEQLKPLPDQLALVVGDALQCLRNSLDHLIWGLARKHSPLMTAKQEKDTQFPVGDDAIMLSDLRIGCLSQPARQDVCDLAPDPGRQALDQDPLWLLHKASNRDKHRELTVAAFAAGPINYSLFTSDGSDYFRAYGPQRLQLGAPPVTLFEFAGSPNVKAEIRHTLDVVFDQGVEVADRPIVGTLRSFHEHIRDTVFQRLEPHL